MEREVKRPLESSCAMDGCDLHPPSLGSSEQLKYWKNRTKLIRNQKKGCGENEELMQKHLSRSERSLKSDGSEKSQNGW